MVRRAAVANVVRRAAVALGGPVVLAAVNELLHSAVGEIAAPGRCPDAPAHYCGRGWLNGTVDAADRFLPEPLADELEDDGLAPADAE